MGGAIATGDRDPRAQPGARQPSPYRQCEPRLAAEEMGRAGDVEPESVGRIGGGERRPAAGGMIGDARDQCLVTERIGWTDVEAGDHRLGLGERLAGCDAERARFCTSCGDHQPLAVGDAGDERLPVRRCVGRR